MYKGAHQTLSETIQMGVIVLLTHLKDYKVWEKIGCVEFAGMCWWA